GGGGGGGGSVKASVRASYLIAPLVADKKNVLVVRDPSLSWRKVEFVSDVNAGRASLDVEVAPVSEVAVLGDAYQYVKVSSAPVFRDSDFESVLVEFAVNRSWVDVNGYEPKSVVLKRFVGGVWVEADTSLVAIGSDDYRYSAGVPGFSYFAVVAKARVSGHSVAGSSGSNDSVVVVQPSVSAGEDSDSGVVKKDGLSEPPDISKYTFFNRLGFVKGAAILTIMVALILLTVAIRIRQRKKG
ncbi:PGF-pre-PGF domain-containing protein, partial [Candidatus Woesearchaeota archaeon]|nr:PGF-pre-PGF domain-containing protein [Candidatus Woesearchaeota archaeon]